MPAPSINPSLAATQRVRLERYRATRSVDIHCHCLPGIDDGPSTLADALAMCRLLVRDGFTDVIATPHQLGRYEGMNWAAEIRRAVSDLQAALVTNRIPLRVHAGAEVRIDERIPKLMESGHILTLADAGEYLLLELPSQAAVAPRAVAHVLGVTAVNVVLAHAERYDSLRRDPPALQEWLDAGAFIQVNANSLLEDNPRGAYAAARHWLSHGWVSLIATDSHNAGSRRPRMSEALELIEQEFGHEIARETCVMNPLRLLEGDDA